MMNKMISTTRFSLLIAVLLMGWVACSTPPTLQEKAEQADALITTTLDENELPGISVTVLKAGEQVYSKGFGFADIEAEKTIDPSTTRFRIGSVSKTFAASALMTLVEDNKVHLDSSVYSYVPNFPKKKWTITPRQVAGHLSGIRHYRGDEMNINRFYSTVDEALSIFEEDTLLHEPGSKYLYSTHAWTLLSAVIEQAAGTPYLDYMQESVFDPLSMTNTHPELSDLEGVDKVSYYVRDSLGSLIRAPEVDNSWKWAGGGFISTTEDVARFLWQHAEPSYLTAESLSELTTPQQTTSGELTDYGLGWSTREDAQANRLIGHTGGSVGGTTFAFMQPDSEVVVVMTTNVSGAGFGSLANDLFALYR
jgi:CubicO group peptidase (beta-lactamase class C family)